METLKKKWEDLDLSRDEVRNIGEALQKEEFRNLLLDYVKEINDPENKKQYEQEITQLEQERGVDVKFIHPTSGYVIKTSVNGNSKAFLNICSNDYIGKPSSAKDVSNGHLGLRWSIPHSLAPPREDLDKKGNACIVYDVVFHPDALFLSKSNNAFKKIVEETALSAVEENFNVSLDKINIKYPKIQFKGLKHPTVIRSKIKNFSPSADLIDLPNYPYPEGNDLLDAKQTKTTDNLLEKQSNQVIKSTKETSYTKPKYSIKYRNTLDMQNYTNDPLSKRNITVPNELIIVIDLPLLKCSTDATVDVTENRLILKSESPAKYNLQLKLPYLVDSNKGSAKFDSSKKVLTITLSVIKPESFLNDEYIREDSGVESDNYNARSNSVSSNEDDTVNHESYSHEIMNNISNHNSQLNNNREQSFLKDNIHYVFPDYNGSISGKILNFTLQVPHVNPESVEYCFLNKRSGFHLTFISMGSGFFPVNYAFYVLLPSLNQLDYNTFNVEVWDNNVIVHAKLLTCEKYLTEYCIGIDAQTNNKVELPVGPSTEECLEREKGIILELVNNTDDNETIEKLSDEEKNPIVSESASSFDESNSSPPRLSPKSRTVSESHQEDKSLREKYRGILKIGRSLSESSMDDYAAWSAEKNEKVKKTVRFSDVIYKQTFRLNSSILGQRKKNQRKTRNKKRAQERRLSESGGESEAENDFSSTKRNNNLNGNEEIDFLTETESSSCDVSEVSDVSESDDGQKVEVKPFVPCSNKKNHKRRGKKSARKNAATSKYQFMDN